MPQTGKLLKSQVSEGLEDISRWADHVLVRDIPQAADHGPVHVATVVSANYGTAPPGLTLILL